MKIGIIGAMRAETELIASLLSKRREVHDAGIDLIVGRLFVVHEVVLCTCGVGKSNAAAATQLLISKYGVEAIINTGIAGNADTELSIGDVVIGQTLVYHDLSDEILNGCFPFQNAFTADAELCAAARTACERLGVKYKSGIIATGDLFVEDTAVRDDIKARTSCACIEMEGAAIAHIATKNGVPFTVLRVMSDNADDVSAAGIRDNTLDITGYCELSRNLIKQLVTEL